MHLGQTCEFWLAAPVICLIWGLVCIMFGSCMFFAEGLGFQLVFRVFQDAEALSKPCPAAGTTYSVDPTLVDMDQFPMGTSIGCRKLQCSDHSVHIICVLVSGVACRMSRVPPPAPPQPLLLLMLSWCCYCYCYCLCYCLCYYYCPCCCCCLY